MAAQSWPLCSLSILIIDSNGELREGNNVVAKFAAKLGKPSVVWTSIEERVITVLMLPLGTYSLSEIYQWSNPVQRVAGLATLLEFILRTQPGTPHDSRRPIMLGELLEIHQGLFANIARVKFAGRVRNRLIHALGRTTPERVVLATLFLRGAILDVLDRLGDKELRILVTEVSPYVTVNWDLSHMREGLKYDETNDDQYDLESDECGMFERAMDAYDDEYSWGDEGPGTGYLSQYIECAACKTVSSTRCTICDRCHCRLKNFDYSRLACGDCVDLATVASLTSKDEKA